jgi:hypothetical protein
MTERRAVVDGGAHLKRYPDVCSHVMKPAAQ